jgi:hypothetical protein
MEAVGQEGNLTLVGWLAVLAMISGGLALLYVVNECQKRDREQERQQKREPGQDPSFFN